MLNYNYGPDCNYSDSSTQISFIAKTGERLTTPKMVYDYLSKRIYKQVSLFCGPTGSGKTYLIISNARLEYFSEKKAGDVI